MRGNASLLPPPAMRSAPVVQVYRGVRLTLDQAFYDLYHPGAVVPFYAFTSTSLSHGVADEFAAADGKGGVIFVIQASEHVNMAHYSKYPTEDEFLLPPGCRLTVRCRVGAVPHVWPTGRGVGDEGKTHFVYLKWASRVWLSIENFIFSARNFFLVLGGWVVWLFGGGSARSPPPPPLHAWISTSLSPPLPAAPVHSPVGRVRTGR